jgi:hypothetical protein
MLVRQDFPLFTGRKGKELAVIGASVVIVGSVCSQSQYPQY